MLLKKYPIIAAQDPELYGMASHGLDPQQHPKLYQLNQWLEPQVNAFLDALYARRSVTYTAADGRKIVRHPDGSKYCAGLKLTED